MIKSVIKVTFLLGLASYLALFLLTQTSKRNIYHFTTYKISFENHEKIMTWVSKASGRSECSELAVYKRNFSSAWIEMESSCVQGNDLADHFLDVSYDDWLRGKFDKERASEPYSYFRDGSRNPSLIYFSDMDPLSSQGLLEKIGSQYKNVLSDWVLIRAR